MKRDLQPSCWTCFGFVFLSIAASLAAAETKRPNVLFIMSDDHAAHAVGAYGGRLAEFNPTPTLDRLAAEGTRYTRFFCSNSICTPSRATLMTGQYSHTNGIRTLEGELPADRQTLAHRMRDAGYQTAIIGKWHLKAEPGAFDHYCVLNSQGKYFNPVFRVRGPKPWPENTIRPSDHKYDSIHSSDAITNLSIEWLANRKSDKPFFLMHHFKAPHDNFENAERYDWLFNDVTIPEPASLQEPVLHGTSVSRRNTRRNMGHHMKTPETLPDAEYTAETYQRYLKKYLRCIRGVDDNIARLLAQLEEMDELENTIVVYTSDQGFMLGEHDLIDKRWMYEPSMRMPLIVWGPGRVEAGQVRDDLLSNVDLLPTLVDLAGGQAGEGVQGRSFVATTRGEEHPNPRDAVYYRYWMHQAHHDVPAHYGVRTGDYKLAFYYGQPLDAEGARDTPTEPYWELYDLNGDPDETNNLIDDPGYAEIAEGLKARMLELRSEVGDTDSRYPQIEALREATW